MLLGHLDTVWPRGTLEKMAWRVRGGRAYGPGVYDMKAGTVMALAAMEMVRARKMQRGDVVLRLVPDEEVGSAVSRTGTERLARKCEAVFVLEPAQGEQGALKTARKGVGMFRIEVTGVAAHSGVDFERGHSAVHELARQIEKVGKFTDLERGLTVNAGVIGGGTRSNVVAERAWAEIDVRIAKASDGTRVEKLFRGLNTFNRSCKLKVTGGMNRPPMERSARGAALFKRAQRLASGLGFAIEEAATGGGSDGNFTAAIGVPTLDGMGAVGAGAHAKDEHVVMGSLGQRAALLAAMIAEL
jgi:glutamate carboxypeptidase